MHARRSSPPLSFFGVAVGLLAFANAWRVAVRLWHLPDVAADGLVVAGLAVWIALLAAQIYRWTTRREELLAELAHPVQSSFAALAGVSSLLAALALLPYSRPLALAVFVLAVSGQLALSLWLHGRFWQGGQAPELVTAAIYLPAVGQNFVAGTASVAFGWPQLGALFFGAGLFSWLAIESLILGRAAVHSALPVALRPVLGIQLAPPVVGGITYLGLNGGVPDLFAQILLGYGVYQALLLLRLLPWIRAQAFAPSYWAFSFGVAALPTLAMRLAERGATGLIAVLAPVSFVVANVIFALLIVYTLLALARGQLLPVVVAPAAAPPLPAVAG